MIITNEWEEITLSMVADWTTIQNRTGSSIIITLGDVLPTNDDNAILVKFGEAWTYVHDTRKFYVRGLYIKDGKSGDVTVL